ncbi:MAG: hypothetical protein OES24_13675, partial [Acidimicrobiia bacterium]|nr:hypothetical protein [Acidimicrobiia bacterium]
QATATITVAPVDDTSPEPDETVELTLAVDPAYQTAAPPGDTATVTIVDNDLPSQLDALASSENTAEGTIVSGDLNSTHASDGTAEEIREIRTGGKPASRISSLQHYWSFDVPAGDEVTFHVEAHHTQNAEGDDFVFAYSSDGVSYTDMLMVTKTVDDGRSQSYTLPPDVSGSVTVRVTDLDRTEGAGELDAVIIDHMFIRVIGSGPFVPAVTVVASDALASEAGDTGTFVVTRSGSTAGELTVAYDVAGSATNSVDYQTLSGVVVIPDGVASATMTVVPLDDPSEEGDETVTVTLAVAPAYTVANPASATVTIADDDGAEEEAVGETTFNGTATGSFVATAASDNIYESITEELYAGGRRTRLEHHWTFDLGGASSWTFFVEAHHDDPVEDFEFSYSVDGTTWTPMILVSKSVDDDMYQTVAIPDSLSGPVTVRVTDTDRSRNESNPGTIRIDDLHFVPT